MKKLFIVCVALSFAANILIARGYYSGGYGSYPYGGYQYPGFGDDDQDYDQYPGGFSKQPFEPQKTEPKKSEEPQRPTTFEQQYPKLIVMFTKDECGYCRYLKPIIEQVEMKYGNDIQFLYVDVVKNPQYAAQYGFATVPQIIYFKDGKRLEMHGSDNKTMTAQQVEDKIKMHFGDAPSP